MDFKKLIERTNEMRLLDAKYKCWDCDKELINVHFDEDTKKKLLIDMDGFLRILCIDCKDNEDY